ncbi:type I-E CRISPR-associated protein Cse2/CasB [Methanomassiliicoccales archaeon LGM-DZ1]|nr:type I-E CRISPR-associated protein Cse2/CasB [Methanomassiliicoccales archaeon LGM-DZ1]
MTGEFVRSKIGQLQTDSPWAKAMLAELRRGIGKDISESPGTWEVVLADMPEELIYAGKEECRATEAESAAYTALTLFALHKQSGDIAQMNGLSFGAAARNLADGNNDAAIKRRFDAVMTSTNLKEVSNHARGLIQLMKAADRPVGFDYVEFAKDLYRFQFTEGRRSVCLRWGQDFYAGKKASNKENEKAKIGE